MRIVIVCREGLLREGIVCLLTYVGGFQIVSSEGRLKAAVARAKEQEIDVIVVDEKAVDAADWEHVTALRENQQISVVCLAGDITNRRGPLPIDTEVERNANGIELIRAIREAKHGEELAGAGKGVRVRERMTPYGMAQDLSPRELEVAQLVAKGLPNRRIATITGLQEQSVKNLVSTIMRKLRCENRVQVALCLSTGKPGGVQGD